MKSKIVLHQGALKIEFYKKTKLLYNTRIRVESKHWNKKKQAILPHGNIDVESLNSEIHSKRAWIDSLLLKDLQAYGEIDVDRVKSKVKLKVDLSKSNLIEQVHIENKQLKIGTLFQLFVDNHQSEWNATLSRRYQNLQAMVVSENILMEDLDKMYLRRLIKRISAGELGNGINTNTLKWRFKKFKSFHKWCVEKGHAKHSEHLNNVFKEIKDFEPDFITLSENRIQELFDYRSKYITYNKVRDTVLILIFTGMRYSDYETLIPSDIVNGYIDKISKKTKIRFKVPIHPSVRDLIMRFSKPLPQQKFNYYFKKVGEDLDWGEETRIRVDFDKWKIAPFHSWLSSHVGRHTAATRWLLQSIPTHVIKIWGGWRKESMINHYGEKIKLFTEDYMTRVQGNDGNHSEFFNSIVESESGKILGMSTNNS